MSNLTCEQTAELLDKACIEMSETMSRLVAYRQQLTHLAFEIDGDIFALNDFIKKVETLENPMPHEQDEMGLAKAHAELQMERQA